MKIGACIEKNFNALQESIMDFCVKLGKEIGASVYHSIEIEEEYSIEHKLKVSVAAPCGCCRIEPKISIGDKDCVSKLKFLKEVHDIIRKRVNEYSYMYGVDYSDQYDGDEEKLFSKTVKEVSDDFCEYYVAQRRENYDSEDEIDEEDFDENGNLTFGVKDYSVKSYGC